mmetsp:Transcript_120972/g.338707  ORF Transcript_120972/g.338707 Transcript_120972/m.338707 type:complete len:217 (-) Transcript_120972:642-1292(-)
MYTCWRNVVLSIPSKSAKRRVNAFSWRAGLPICSPNKRSTLRHNQVHATSCSESQPFGTNDRNAANITALNSARSMGPRHFDKRSARMSHSSWRRCEFDTLRTIMSKESSTSYIQRLSPNPMTAALNLNICGKVVGISRPPPRLRTALLGPELPPADSPSFLSPLETPSTCLFASCVAAPMLVSGAHSMSPSLPSSAKSSLFAIAQLEAKIRRRLA